MNTPDELQDTLQGWDGTSDPPGLSAVRESQGYKSLSPAGRFQALNQAQRNWAKKLRSEDPKNYGGYARDIDRDFTAARAEELESGIAEDLKSGALTEDEAKAMLTKGYGALNGKTGYVEERYGAEKDIPGPFAVQKTTIVGADGKPVGYAHTRRDTSGGPVEIAYHVNGKKGAITGVDDVDPSSFMADQEKELADTMTPSSAAGAFAAGAPLANAALNLYRGTDKSRQAKVDEYNRFRKLSEKDPDAFASEAAATIFNKKLQNDPSIAREIGQGFLAGLPGQATKGFLKLGASATYGLPALLGSRDALRKYDEAGKEIEADIEGQSRSGFRGGKLDKLGMAVTEEILPTLFSMGTSVAAAGARKLATAATEKAAEAFLKQAGVKSLETAPPLLRALSGGFGKIAGTAKIEGPIRQQLADRVLNSISFLPNSMRGGLDNMMQTLDAADAARAAGDEKKARELEDNAVMNGWAGTLTETLSENMWLNEMLVTRAGRSLADVSSSVLSRRLGDATKLQRITGRVKDVMGKLLKNAGEEGVEEVVSGISNRAWMNQFAEQNKDVLEGVGEEFVVGAVMGGVMGAAKSFTKEGKPEMERELLRRGLEESNKPALDSWARIQAKARGEAPTAPATPLTVAPESAPVPTEATADEVADILAPPPPQPPPAAEPEIKAAQEHVSHAAEEIAATGLAPQTADALTTILSGPSKGEDTPVRGASAVQGEPVSGPVFLPHESAPAGEVNPLAETAVGEVTEDGEVGEAPQTFDNDAEIASNTTEFAETDFRQRILNLQQEAASLGLDVSGIMFPSPATNPPGDLVGQTQPQEPTPPAAPSQSPSVADSPRPSTEPSAGLSSRPPVGSEGDSTQQSSSPTLPTISEYRKANKPPTQKAQESDWIRGAMEALFVAAAKNQDIPADWAGWSPAEEFLIQNGYAKQGDVFKRLTTGRPTVTWLKGRRAAITADMTANRLIEEHGITISGADESGGEETGAALVGGAQVGDAAVPPVEVPAGKPDYLTDEEWVMQSDVREDDDLTQQELDTKLRGETKIKRAAKTKDQADFLREQGVEVDSFLEGSNNHITHTTLEKDGSYNVRIEKHSDTEMVPLVVNVVAGESLSNPGTLEYVEGKGTVVRRPVEPTAKEVIRDEEKEALQDGPEVTPAATEVVRPDSAGKAAEPNAPPDAEDTAGGAEGGVIAKSATTEGGEGDSGPFARRHENGQKASVSVPDANKKSLKLNENGVAEVSDYNKSVVPEDGDWRLDGEWVKPRKVGAKWTKEQQDKMEAAFKGAGFSITRQSKAERNSPWSTSPPAGRGFRILRGEKIVAEAVADRKAAKAQAEKSAAEAEKAARMQAVVSGTDLDAGEWIDATFGAGVMNDTNRRYLADYLTGKAPKFHGMVNPKWVTGVDKAGARKGDGVDFEKLKQVYEQDKKARADSSKKRPGQGVVREEETPQASEADNKNRTGRGESNETSSQVTKIQQPQPASSPERDASKAEKPKTVTPERLETGKKGEGEGEEAAPQLVDRPFQPDEILEMRSPHTGDVVSVNYRGPLGDKSVVVMPKGGQTSIPTAWLSRSREAQLKILKDEFEVAERRVTEAEDLIEKGKPLPKEYQAASKAMSDIVDRIATLESPLKEAAAREKETKDSEAKKQRDAARDKRIAELPAFQMRNGWEIVKDFDQHYILRDPSTKEDVYSGKLNRVRQVADESPPQKNAPPREESGAGAEPGPKGAPPTGLYEDSGKTGNVKEPEIGDSPEEIETEVEEHLEGKPKRSQKAIKDELIEKLEAVIAKLPEEIPMRVDPPKTKGGKREFSIVPEFRGKKSVYRVREGSGDWTVSRLEDGKYTDIGKVGGYMGPVEAAQRATGIIENDLRPAEGGKRVIIRIPGDGTFTINKTRAALELVLRKVKSLPIKTTPTTVQIGRATPTVDWAFKDFGIDNPDSPSELKAAKDALATTQRHILGYEKGAGPELSEAMAAAKKAYEKTGLPQNRYLTELISYRTHLERRIRQMEGIQKDVVKTPNKKSPEDATWISDEPGNPDAPRVQFSRGVESVRLSKSLRDSENMEEVALSVFENDRTERDDYLYHVTTKDRVDAIVYEGEGLHPNRGGQFAGVAAQNNSRGRIFLTERGGVNVWANEIEQQLFHSRDYDENQEPRDDLTVIRIPKNLVSDLQDDFAERPAEKGRDYFTTKPIPASPPDTDIRQSQVSKSSEGAQTVTEEAASTAFSRLQRNAPEIAENVTIVANASELDPNEFHPDDWRSINDGRTEAFFRPATGETVILRDNIRQRPNESPIRAVTRVIMHERLAHAGLALLRSSDPLFQKQWDALVKRIPSEALDEVRASYPELVGDINRLAEEWVARQAEGEKAGQSGLMRQLWDALKSAVARLWRKLTGASSAPAELNRMVKELLAASRQALKNRAAVDGRGNVSLSRSEMDAIDKEYFAAVESGDVAKQQAMVDAAAKGAGYNVGPVWHGTKGKFNTFEINDDRRRDSGWLGRGFYFTVNGPEFAESFGPRVISAYLKADKIFDVRTASIQDAITLVNASRKKKGLEPLSAEKEIQIRTDWRDMTRKEDWAQFEGPIPLKRESFIKNLGDPLAMAEAAGYDAVRGAFEGALIVSEASQIKSADPVTRDEQGNVIPPSQRFNPDKDDIRFSRSQEMGVEDLGAEHRIESINAVREAIAGNVFNAAAADPASMDDYTAAHELARALTSGDAAALERIQARVLAHPAMAAAGLTGTTQLQTLPGVLYGELMTYAGKLAAEGGYGGTADFGLLTMMARNYSKILDAQAALTSDIDSSGVTKLGQRMRALREVSGPFGKFLEFFRDQNARAVEEMRRQGWTQEQIDALEAHVTGKINAETLADVLKAKDAELARVTAALAELQKQMKALEPGETPFYFPANPPALTPAELALLPKEIQEAYRQMKRGRLEHHLNAKQLKQVEDTLFNLREQMTESGVQSLADAFFVGLQEPAAPQGMLGQKLDTVNAEMGSIIRETLADMGIVAPETAPDSEAVFKDIALALGSDELRLEKVPLIEEAIQQKIMQVTGKEDFESAMEDEWAQAMWAQWESVSANLNASTKVSGGTLNKAVRSAMESLEYKTDGLLNMRPEHLDVARGRVVDNVMNRIRDVSASGTSNIQEGMWPAVRREVESRFNRMVAQAVQDRARRAAEAQARRNAPPENPDGAMEARVRRITRRFATPDTPNSVTPNKDAIEQLVADHLKKPVADFTGKAAALGIPEGAAVELERAITSARTAREDVNYFSRTERAARKAVDALMAKVDPKAGKLASFADIVTVLNNAPLDMVHDPAWRRGVISDWLYRMGVDESRLKAAKLDALVATAFASAQEKMVRDFVESAKPKVKKPGASELQRLNAAIRQAWITGAPDDWKSAFTDKFKMRPLTVPEMQKVLKLEMIISDPNSNITDRSAAAGKAMDIYRKAGVSPSFWQIAASSYTQSLLTSFTTETMQFTQAAFNMAFRLMEEALTGGGPEVIIRAANEALDAYGAALNAAWTHDAYRNQQQEEIRRLTALKTVLEKSVEQWRAAKGLAKLNPALLTKITVGAQDLFRRIMSSADDAAVTGVRAMLETIEFDRLMRRAGMKKADIRKLYETAAVLAADKQLEAIRRGYTGKASKRGWGGSMARMWARDEVDRFLRTGMAAAGVSPDDITSAQNYAEREGVIETGIGEARDEGSVFDPHFWGEAVISRLEPLMHTHEKDPGKKAGVQNILFRALLGFIRTPFNFLSRSIYRSPLGFLRLALAGNQERASRLYARTMGTARQRQQRFKEAIVWSTVESALALMALGLRGDKDDPEDDAIVFNGSGPDDPQARAAWMAAGHTQNSIEINAGGARVKLPFGRAGLEALKPGLMLMGSMRDMELNGMAKGQPSSVLEFAKTYGENAIYSANLFGLRNIADLKKDAASPKQLAGKIAYMTSGIIPFSGAIKSVGKVFLPDRRDTSSLAGTIAVSTPAFWLGEKGYNLYGLPVYGTPSSTIGKVTGKLMWAAGFPFSIDTGRDESTAEVLAWSIKTGMAPTAPSRQNVDEKMLKADKNHQAMTNKEWMEYSKAAGEYRLKAMKDTVPIADKMSANALENRLEAIGRQAHLAGMRAVAGK